MSKGLKSAHKHIEQIKCIKAYRVIIKLFKALFLIKNNIKHAITGNIKIKLIIIQNPLNQTTVKLPNLQIRY